MSGILVYCKISCISSRKKKKQISDTSVIIQIKEPKQSLIRRMTYETTCETLLAFTLS